MEPKMHKEPGEPAPVVVALLSCAVFVSCSLMGAGWWWLCNVVKVVQPCPPQS